MQTLFSGAIHHSLAAKDGVYVAPLLLSHLFPFLLRY